MDQKLKEKFLLDLQSDVEDIRKDACRILAQDGDHSVLDVLQEISSNDTVAVRYFARKAVNAIIKRCGKPGEWVELDLEEFLKTEKESGETKLDQKTFISYLTNPDRTTRLALIDISVEIAAEVGSQFVLPSLARHLPDVADPKEKSFLIKTIGILGTKEEIPAIIAFLKDDDPRVRADTIEALEYIGDASIYPVIIPLLQDDDNRVRANASVALRFFGEEQSLQLLEKMLTSNEVWMRDSAAYALGEIKSPRAVKILLNALKRELKYNVYFKAIESMARIGSKSDIPRVKAILQIEEDKRKITMLGALIKSLHGRVVDFSKLVPQAGLQEQEEELAAEPGRESRVLEQVSNGLKPFVDTGERVKQKPVAVAVSENLPKLVSTLINDLSNPDEDIRKQAAIKLVTISDPRAIPALNKAAADQDNVVRYFAKKALRAMQTKGVEIEIPSERDGRKSRLIMVLLKYGAVGIAGVVALLFITWEIYSWTAPQEKILEARKEITSSFERLVKAYDRYKGMGEKVTWKGIVQKVDIANRTLMLTSHTYVFSAQIPPEDSQNYFRGDMVQVTGVVKSRSMFGAVTLEASAVEVVEPNKEARKRAMQSKALKPGYDRRMELHSRDSASLSRPGRR